MIRGEPFRLVVGRPFAVCAVASCGRTIGALEDRLVAEVEVGGERFEIAVCGSCARDFRPPDPAGGFARGL